MKWKSTASVIFCLIMSLTVQAQQKKPTEQAQVRPGVSFDLRAQIGKAVTSMVWSSEGEDTLKVFFLPAGGQIATIEGNLISWVESLKKSQRPERYEAIETEELNEFLEDLVNPGPMADGKVDPDDKATAEQWKRLEELLVQKLRQAQVYHVGSDESFKIIVIAGRDNQDNLVGVWMRHWSS